MTVLQKAEKFETYLPYECTTCEYFQALLVYELANPGIAGIKPTIAKCVPTLLKDGFTGRKLTVVYVGSKEDAPVHTVDLIGSCPDKLGPTGLNTK